MPPVWPRIAPRSSREQGVAARIETIPGLVSFPREAELTILAPEHKVLPANTFGHSVETLPEGISGELVYVGSGHFADYEGKDVAGKITLSELSYSPGPSREAAHRRAHGLDRPDHAQLGSSGERGACPWAR